MLLDTHFHLDFCSENIRPDLERLGVKVVAQTVLPSDFSPGPLNSLGYHPWWVGEDIDEQLAAFDTQLESTRLIGEVGLDFSPKRLNNKDKQIDAFQHILSQLSKEHVMSIHAVRSATTVLDLLENCLATPIFHWFSGTSDELNRLIQTGGYISVNPRMLESKRGRAYVTQVPEDRLLLETDLPGEEGPCSAAKVADLLTATLNRISDLRGQDMSKTIEENQARLFPDF